MNGTMVLPVKSRPERKVMTGGTIVLNQLGEPTKITSYGARLGTSDFNFGIMLSFSSCLPRASTSP